jgi:hypothetical protein
LEGGKISFISDDYGYGPFQGIAANAETGRSSKYRPQTAMSQVLARAAGYGLLPFSSPTP